MKMKTRLVDDVALVDIHGDISIGEGDIILKDRILALLEDGFKKIVLNLEGVKYMDSSGVGELVNCHTTVKHKGAELKLMNLTKKIREVLTITKLILVFDNYDNEKDAIASFKK